MSGFPGKKHVVKTKEERKLVVKSGPQILAEQRWVRKMQAQKDAEQRFIIKRWIDLKNTLQKPPQKRLAELREAEKRQVEEGKAMQRQERWREWMQKERVQWEAEQRQKEQELNSSKKKLEDLQETKTPQTQVLKSPTILEELKMLDELLEETADIKVPSMSPIHQPVSPSPPPLPLGKDATYLGLTSTKPPSLFVEMLPLACEASDVQQKSLLCLQSAAQAKAEKVDYGKNILRDESKVEVKENEGLESGLWKMQVLDASVEERSNSEILKKMEEVVKAERGKAAMKEEFIEKQKKAEKLAQEKMEKKQREQLEQAEKSNREIKTKLEKERRKMKDLERKEMQRLAEEQRTEMKKEKEEKKAEMGSLRKRCGFFEKIKRAFHFH
ncbi:calponin homology domain-containing protein DDB_G0272472-like [Osmerus eperlanus]|uniref:calponin homology domain-containing protein DDB_G0272472-like n=1 Tax=Osmerus eperlanus TaxID=29151 RepID=UPI002E10B100